MTADDFRKMALGHEGAIESEHMGHPDFRVGGKIFATLGYPDSAWGVVMLTPEEQKAALEAQPDAFLPAAGAWGLKGSTRVQLDIASKKLVREAIKNAWSHKKP